MNADDRYYLHALNCLPQFGPVRLNRLRAHFPDFAAAYQAGSNQLFEAGIEPHIIKEWFSLKSRLDVARESTALQTLGIKILIYDDDAYPKILQQIPQSPPILYYRGAWKNNEELCLGVVGTRKISAYGQSITEELVAPLAAAGISIVSGMAYGVDAAAHCAAIKHGGRTIAILGGGLDDGTIYPRHHVALAHEIIDSGGLVISEYPPGCPALRQNFVARNRIISGLSAGVLIIECGEKSGALITADYALDQNRNVYAVPGPIYSPTSRGTNDLLKQGAIVITDAADILRDLKLQLPLQEAEPASTSLTPSEQTILALIGPEPILADDILAVAGLDPGIVTAALTFLEIKGHIRNLKGQQYVRVK